MMALSREQAMAEGLPPEGPAQVQGRALSAEQAAAEGLPADGPNGEPYRDPRAMIGDAVIGAGKSALEWANTPFKAMEPILADRKAQANAAGPAPINRVLGVDEKSEPDWLAGAKTFLSGAPGFQRDAASTASDERQAQFRSENPIKAFLLSMAGAGAGPAYLPSTGGTAAAGGGLMDRLTSWLKSKQAGLETRVGDMGVKGAEDTARSAVGSYRSARGDTSTILKALERVTGDPATDAASKALLESQAGKKLIMEVVQNAQERAPDALNRVDSLKALVDETHAAIPQARAAAISDEGLRSTMSQRTKDQFSRYLLPAAGGAAGAAIGGPVGMGIGAAAGRGISPGVRAVVLNNVLAPERRLLMTRSALNTAQKLAAAPETLGKFALPLTQAANKGDDALAATHYILAQDPGYQKLMHDASEEQ